MFSINTDYITDKDSPEPVLRHIAQAGFTHVHWCHHWASDFIYHEAEIAQIGRWLSSFGLKLLDLHGSAGIEKQWVSDQEYQRAAGVELVRNRIEMTARLGGDAVVMHIPNIEWPHVPIEQARAAIRQSLDELEPFARQRHIKIALENTFSPLFWGEVQRLLADYAPSYLGVCYDSGHGHISGNGLEELEKVKDRLICVHLHDNNTLSDQHKLPFTGSIDWNRLLKIIRESAYQKCLNQEVSVRNMETKEDEPFLRQAFDAAQKLTALYQA